MQKTSLLIAGIVMTSVLTYAEDWKPVPGKIMTRWADQVDPANPLPEYPRPQMVRPQWENLNGLWEYATTDQAQRPDAFDGNILVPFCLESALSGVKRKLEPGQTLWYRRTFEIDYLAADRRVLLHFGAVDWQATVFINGREAGKHSGGFDPFSLDITDLLKPSGHQELVVQVLDPTDQGFQPIGKQRLVPKGIWYTAVSGIWQTVWLETVPKNHIRGLHLVPDLDAGAVSVTVEASRGGAVEVQVLDGKREVARMSGTAGQPMVVKIPEAKSWSPDRPHLYGLRIQLGEDEVHSYTGLRKIEVRKDEVGVNRLFLNGKALFQHGPLDQGWWPDGLYTAPTDEALRFDIDITKAMGFNMTRKHVKVEPARWYYWCDVVGLLVWQDMPSTFKKTPEALHTLKTEMQAMVDAFGNHPSIVMWVPFNEGWGQQDTENTVAWLEQYDPTRLINNASGWTDTGVGDVLDIHSYPGPAAPPLEADRANVLGEYGGLGLVVDDHLWQADKNWGYRSFKTAAELEERYAALTTSLRSLIAQGLAASIYTQITDVEIEVNGLLTYDRKVEKIAPEKLARMHAPLYLPPPLVRTLVPSAERGAKISWRYTTSQPGPDWMQPTFEDGAWQSGVGGFGSRETPGARIGTEWTGSDIWLRRTFELDTVPEGLVELVLHHDEDAVIYLNGQEAAKREGYTTDYTHVPCAKNLLQTGTNTLAIHCHQTRGGQYIDAGISEVVEQP